MNLMRTLPLVLLLLCGTGTSTATPAQNPTFRHADGQATDVRLPGLARWWEDMGDPALAGLVARALADNPGLAAATARVEQARATARLDRAALLPQVGLAAGSGLFAIPGTAGDSDVRLSAAGLDARWEIDIFGRGRQSARAGRAAFEAVEADRADYQLRLATEVASTYVRLRTAQQGLENAREAQALSARRHELVALRVRQGASGQADLDQASHALAERDARLARATADVAALRDALSVLTGQAPGMLDAELAAPAPVPVPPAVVAIGDPAAMLQRRPDIRAAERRLAASVARTKAARAARFPQIALLGMIGIGDSDRDIGGLDGDIGLGVIPLLRWDFLDFGRSAARVRAGRAAQDEADALYRMTVNAALQDAEDALARYGQSRIELAARHRQQAVAENGLALVEQRRAQGRASDLDHAAARIARIDSQDQLNAATAERSLRYIALQKALGLGWQAAGPPSE